MAVAIRTRTAAGQERQADFFCFGGFLAATLSAVAMAFFAVVVLAAACLAGGRLDEVAGAAAVFWAGWRDLASLAAATLASRAAMMSTTFGFCGRDLRHLELLTVGLHPDSANTCSRYSSWYFAGSNSAVSDSTSDSAMATSRAFTSMSSRPWSSSIEAGSTTSSA